MKKILMMAAAGAVSLSALAVVPQLNSRPDASRFKLGTTLERLSPSLNNMRKDVRYDMTTAGRLMKYDARMNRRNFFTAEAATGTTLEARYMDTPFFCFYVGTTPDGLIYPLATTSTPPVYMNEGIGAGDDNFGFLNMSTGATSYKWEYSYVDADTPASTEPMTATTENLVRYVALPSAISSPLLYAYNGGQESQYISQYVTQYNFNVNLASCGIQPSQIFSDFDPETMQDYYGVTNCPVNIRQGGYMTLYEAAKNTERLTDEDKDAFTPAGCPAFWNSFISKNNSSDLVGVKDVKFSFVLNQLPEQQHAYLTDEMWLHLYYTATEDVELTVTIVPVDDEGYFDFANPIGKGELTLSKGSNNAENSTVTNRFAVNLARVENGRTIDEPVSIYGPAGILLQGIDNEALTYFAPMFNGGTEIPNVPNVDVDDYYPPMASVGFNFTQYEKANPQNTKNGSYMIPIGYLYYGADTDPTYYVPSYLDWNINVLFPFVMNADGGSHLEISMPAEGGEDSYLFESLFPIAPYLEADKLEVEVIDGDWFTYEFGLETVTGQGGEQDINACEIKAEPLPAGVEGRCGVIRVTGFAQDFNLYVGQGEYELPAGIQQVANVPSGKPMYYDLQGRSIKAAPAKGIYIERIGNKATKKLAK